MSRTQSTQAFEQAALRHPAARRVDRLQTSTHGPILPAWGPDLPDGRHVLYVTSDNDLYTGPADADLCVRDRRAATAPSLAYQAQQVAGPVYPSGQVRKALR